MFQIKKNMVGTIDMVGVTIHVKGLPIWIVVEEILKVFSLISTHTSVYHRPVAEFATQ